MVRMNKFIFKKNIQGLFLQKIGFTIAEVLIVLGIVGVVAEMTLPVLVKDFQQQVLKTQYKSVYSTITSAMTQVKINLGDYPSCNYGDNASWADCTLLFTELGKTLNVAKTCGNNSYANGCIPYYNDNNNATCTGFSQTNVSNNNDSYVLSDGTIIIGYGAGGGPLIMIDINGFKPPNKWGYDVFDLQFTKVGSYIRLEPSNCFTPESGGRTSSSMRTYSLMQ